MSQKIKKIIKRIFTECNVTSLPIKLKVILKHYNIALREDVLEDSLSGFLYKNRDQHIITVNSMHSDVRQRFTIAHELGHYFLEHHGNLFIDKGHLYRDARSSSGTIEMEKEANKFAAELLMPQELLYELIDNHGLEDISDIEDIAEKLKVSTQALTYRLSNLGIINLY